MVLLLTNEDCEKIVDLSESVSLMRDAFGRAGKAKTNQIIPRTRLALKNDEADRNFLYTIIGGIVPDSNLVAVRCESGLFNSRNIRRVDLREKSSLIFLYRRTDGTLVAIIHGGYISSLRVAATTAIATDLLANSDVSSMGIIGSGKLAGLHLQVLTMIKRPEKIFVYSPSSTRLTRFCEEMKERCEVAVEPCRSSRDLVKSSQIVTVATNSRRPTFNGKYLKLGSHVNCMLSPDRIFTGQDIDNLTYQRANLTVINSISQAYLDNQIPLLEIMKRKGRIFELAEVVSGRVPGRKKKDDITLYDNNTGLGLQFAAICEYVYKKARRAGIGHAWHDMGFALNLD